MHSTVDDYHRQAEADSWGEPIPLGAERTLPEFPLAALPGWAQEYAAAIRETTQTSSDMPGAMTLAALSAAVGGKADVHPTQGWRTTTNLYVLVVGEVGSRKSEVLDKVLWPIRELQREAQLAAQPLIAAAEAEAKLLERRKTHLIDALAKGRDDATQSDLDEVVRAAASHIVPSYPRYIVGDITTEQLENTLQSQGGTLAMFSAEGGVFDVLTGRYSGGIPNLDAYLKAAGGEPLDVARAARQVWVERPVLTAGMMVQPRVLVGLARNPELEGRGFLARWLYCIAPDTVGSRRLHEGAIPHNVNAAYGRHIKAIFTHAPAYAADGTPVPHSLVLSPDAAALFRDIYHHHEGRQGKGRELEVIAGWASKWVGSVAKIAALLHVAQTGQLRGPIQRHTLEHARQLGEYFLAHARAAFDRMGADREVDTAKLVLSWVVKHGKLEFTKREVARGLGGRAYLKAPDLDAPLALLEAHGYIRPDPAGVAEEGKKRVGRPSAIWLVNPLALETQGSVDGNSVNIVNFVTRVETQGDGSIDGNSQGSGSVDGNSVNFVNFVIGVEGVNDTRGSVDGTPPDDALGESGESVDYVKLTSQNAFLGTETELTKPQTPMTKLTKLTKPGATSLEEPSSDAPAPAPAPQTPMTKLTKLTKLWDTSLVERVWTDRYAVAVKRSDVSRLGTLARTAADALLYTYVGRLTNKLVNEPNGSASDRWGNPWEVGKNGKGLTRNEAVAHYVRWLDGDADMATQHGVNGRQRTAADGREVRLAAALHLRGHALACHCDPEPCHAHILAAYANGYSVSVADDGKALMLWGRVPRRDGRIDVWPVADAAELYATMLQDITQDVEAEVQV
jgi:hypothetical protein